MLLIAIGSPLAAQVPFSACVDRQLQPIPGRVDNGIHAGALATRENGHPVILWNQHNLSQASSPTQLFVYLHECAHHNLNHLTQGEGRTIEDQADCWAYQLLVDGGMLNGHQRDALERELRYFRGDESHLGGEALLRSVKACVAIRTNEPAWDSALTTLTTAAHNGFEALAGPPVLDAPDGTLESLQGPPGTVDCELLVVQGALRCMVYAGRKQDAAEKRFDKLAGFITHWLPADWTAAPRPGGGDLAKSLVAQSSTDGTIIVLGVTTNARVYFMVKAGVTHG